MFARYYMHSDIVNKYILLGTLPRLISDWMISKLCLYELLTVL